MSTLIALLIIPCLLAQTGTAPRPTFSDPGISNLPGQTIGPNDLIGIAVYDAPEFSRTTRVGPDGQIALPMMKHTITAAGLMPRELEVRIAAALRTEELLNEPAVIVTVVEYQSRPISVSGAVRTPLVFQAIGQVRLMDAITKAGGLAAEAGPEALIRSTGASSNGLLRRIPLKELLNDSDPTLDVLLEGGDQVRIPPLPPRERIFVLGNVKVSGAFPIQDRADATVLSMLTLAGGLTSSAPKEAYIVRADADSQGKHQIPIPFKDIFNRKSADVPLLAHDILYIPTTKMNSTLVTVEKILQVAASASLVTTVAR